MKIILDSIAPNVFQLPGRKWQLCSNLLVNIQPDDRASFSFFIPASYYWDGASVPRAVWWFMPPAGEAFYPSLVHDYLYEYGYTLSISKKEADLIFKQLCKDYQVGGVRRYLAHKAVSWFGRGNF